ncbi:hypothetical protein Tco_1098335 [Tanacetum coccineum]
MLKPKLNALNWKNRNLFDKVVKLRDMVKDKQRLLDKDPYIGNLKNDMVKTLNDYQDAMLDEEKLLYQKAKIEWLKKGDHNTAFFHKVIKGRMNKSRIKTDCNNKGERIEGKAVTKEFLNHFNVFLGSNHIVAPIEDSVDLFTKNEGKKVAFKIDIQKAYDTVFTLMLERKIKQNPDFKYHKGYKEFKITHLCFVDDLFVMRHGDKRSVEFIKAVLDEFRNSSGLLPTPNKSTVFFGNVGNSEKEEILFIMPFSVGTLLVRYLGVPLITKRFGVKQCKSLVDKVEKKIKDWKNRWLSFDGRLQLISSILSSIQVYWSSIFLLPSAVTKEINRLLKCFLWVQGELTNGKAKIAWSEVYKPKADDGLGIKDLNLWNKGMLECSIDSWGWKNLLSIRDHIFHHLVYKIGNGSDVSILSNSLKVNDMIEVQCWKGPNEWMRKYPYIVSIPVPTLNNTEDKVNWKNKRWKFVKFCVRNVLEELCDHGKCHTPRRGLDGIRVRGRDVIILQTQGTREQPLMGVLNIITRCII